MKRMITALLALALLVSLGIPAAAQSGDPVLACRENGDSVQLTLENLSAPVYAIQVDLTLEGECPDAAFTPEAAAFVPDCRTEVRRGRTAVTVYLSALEDAPTDGTLRLGTLKPGASFSLPDTAELILLDRDLRPIWDSGTVSVRVSRGTGSGGGSSRPGSGANHNNNSGANSNNGVQPGVSALPFTDVAEGAYYRDAVQWAVARGITSGTTASTFDPDSPCTRAQIVTFLWRAAGSPAVTGGNPFTDVASGSYYETAVQWAVGESITSGTTASTFSPGGACTRAQAVTFLYRAAKSPEAAGGNPFTDISGGSYYCDAVQWAVTQGITSGTTASTFSPGRGCTRAQIVTFLYRWMG